MQRKCYLLLFFFIDLLCTELIIDNKNSLLQQPLFNDSLALVITHNFIFSNKRSHPRNTLKSIATLLSKFACTNKFLNTYINNPQRMLIWIKQLSEIHQCANMQVAKILCTTKEGSERYLLQRPLCDHSKPFDAFYYDQLKKRGLDLNFTEKTLPDFDTEKSISQSYLTILIHQIERKYKYLPTSGRRFWFADNKHYLKKMHWLITNGADISPLICKPERIEIMLFLAIFLKNIDSIKIIFNDQKFNFNMVDAKKNNLLHVLISLTKKYSMHHKNQIVVENIIELLVSNGINYSHHNDKGMTVLDLAQSISGNNFCGEKEIANHYLTLLKLIIKNFQKKLKKSSKQIQNPPHEFCIAKAIEFIIQFIASDTIDNSLKTIARVLNSLARTNKFLNKYINKSEVTLKYIKNLSNALNYSNMEIARALPLKAARNRYELQQSLYEDKFYDHDILKRQGFDVDFTDRFSMGDIQPYVINLVSLSDYFWSENSFGQHKQIIGVIDWLITNGADINAFILNPKNIQAMTATIFLANKQSLPIIFDHPKFNPNIVDENGNNVLHLLISQLCDYQSVAINSEYNPNFKTIIKILLSKGVHYSHRNNQDRTALDLAELDPEFDSARLNDIIEKYEKELIS